LLFGLTVVLAGATLAVVASGDNSKSYADGAGSPAACLGNGNVEGSVTPTGGVASFDVGAGNVVTGVCIKAGNPHSGPLGNGFYDAAFNMVSEANACFEVSGVGTQVVTVTDVGDCPAAGLSHIDVIFGAAPPPEQPPEQPPVQPPGEVTPTPPAPGAPGAPAAAAVTARPVFTG
jgi:hypothetical protein